MNVIARAQTIRSHVLLRCCSDRVPVSQSAVVVPDAIAMAWKVFDVPEYGLNFEHEELHLLFFMLM